MTISLKQPIRIIGIVILILAIIYQKLNYTYTEIPKEITGIDKSKTVYLLADNKSKTLKIDTLESQKYYNQLALKSNQKIEEDEDSILIDKSVTVTKKEYNELKAKTVLGNTIINKTRDTIKIVLEKYKVIQWVFVIYTMLIALKISKIVFVEENRKC